MFRPRKFWLTCLVACLHLNCSSPETPAGETSNSGDSGSLTASSSAADSESTSDQTDDDASTAGDDDPSEHPTLRGPCPPPDDLFGFVVEEQIDIADGLSRWYFDGYAYDGVVPTSVGEVVEASDDCLLLRSPDPRCDPPCTGSNVCSLDEICMPYPVKQDLGVLELSGLTEPVSIEGSSGHQYYSDLPDDPYAAHAVIQLSIPGGEVTEALDLFGYGVPALEVRDETWSISANEALELHWTAPPDTETSRVELFLSIDLHGATRSRLVCNFPDTGEASVPPDMITALIDAGVSGDPQGTLRRHTADSVKIAGLGCLDFQVASLRHVELELGDARDVR